MHAGTPRAGLLLYSTCLEPLGSLRREPLQRAGRLASDAHDGNPSTLVLTTFVTT